MARVQTIEDTCLEPQYGRRFTILITTQPTSCKYCFTDV